MNTAFSLSFMPFSFFGRMVNYADFGLARLPCVWLEPMIDSNAVGLFGRLMRFLLIYIYPIHISSYSNNSLVGF